MLSLKTSDQQTVHEKLCDLFDIDPDARDADVALLAAVHELQIKAEAQTLLLAQHTRDLERLDRYLTQMAHDVQAIRVSRAWRIGYRLTSLLKRVLGRKPGGDGFHHILTVIDHHEHWKKSRD